MQTTSFILRQSVVVWVRTSGYCKSLHLSHFLFLCLYIPLSLSSLSLSLSLSVRHTHTEWWSLNCSRRGLSGLWNQHYCTFWHLLTGIFSCRDFVRTVARATVNHLQFVAITIKVWHCLTDFWNCGFSGFSHGTRQQPQSSCPRTFRAFRCVDPSLPSVFWCVSCCNCCDLLLVLFVCCCFF